LSLRDAAVPDGLTVQARHRGLRGWRPAVRRVAVVRDGRWRWQSQDGRWVDVEPDRLSIGPGAWWLHVSGLTAGPQGRPRRVRATLWRPCVAPASWRRLQVAARWCMAGGRAAPAADAGSATEAGR